jgi:hypothetical protein
VVGLVVTVAAGVLVLVRGREWSGLSGRYDAPTASSRDDPWTVLDRGEDPTLDPTDTSPDPRGP